MIKFNFFKKWFEDKMSFDFKYISVGDIEKAVHLKEKI
jgi:hypothetical protein